MNDRVALPVLVGFDGQILKQGAVAAGYSIMDCADIDEARRVMREYPQASKV